MTQPTAQRGNGVPIHPGDGVVPIMKDLGGKRMAIVGTGFWITRYGFLATAKHIVEELADAERNALGPAFVCHLGDGETVHFRRIRRAHLLSAADVAIAQADNYVERYPDAALMNLKVTLSTQLPPAGTAVVTYAYPENAILDFNNPDNTRVIKGDYSQGGFLRYVDPPENPSMPFPYFETSVDVRPGASGGPVFDTRGRVIGLNCRGWDFRGGEHEADPLSYIAPIALLLDLPVDPFLVPPSSWEARQIPEDRRGALLTVRELGCLGHIGFDPAVV